MIIIKDLLCQLSFSSLWRIRILFNSTSLFILKFKKIEVKLTCNIILVLGAQRSVSVFVYIVNLSP